MNDTCRDHQMDIPYKFGCEEALEIVGSLVNGSILYRVVCKVTVGIIM